jgi:hypothetical protein
MYASFFSFAFIIGIYIYIVELLSLKSVLSLSLNVYLEGLIATNSDPIVACEALREQNNALRQELHDIRRVCILI